MSVLKYAYRSMQQTPRCSPAGFMIWVGIIWVSFAIAHVAGLREHTSWLSGTVPEGSFGRNVGVALGATYIVLYFAAVVVAPVSTIASIIFLALERGVARLQAGRNMKRIRDTQRQP